MEIDQSMRSANFEALLDHPFHNRFLCYNQNLTCVFSLDRLSMYYFLRVGGWGVGGENISSATVCFITNSDGLL